MPGSRKDFQLFTMSAAVRVGGAIAQLLMTLVIARTMEEQSAGIVFFAYALLLLVSQVSLAGSEISGLRAVAISEGKAEPLAVRSSSASRIRLVLLSSSLASVSMFATLSITGSALNRVQLLMVSAAIPAYAIVLLLGELSKGIGRPVLGLTFQNLLIPVMVICFVLIGGSFSVSLVSSFVICAILAASSMSAFAVLVIYSREVGMQPGDFRLGELGNLVRQSPWVWPVSATPAIIQWSGAALLGLISSPAEVANYVVAARLTIAASIIHSAVTSVAAPRLAVSWHSGDLLSFRREAVHAGLAISALAIPVLAGLCIFAEPVLDVFGVSYAQNSANILRILIIGQVVASLCGFSGTVLLMAGSFRTASFLSTFFGVLQLVMTFALVPRLGVLGAAFATALTGALGHVATLVLVRLTLGLWPIPLNYTELRLGIRGHSL